MDPWKNPFGASGHNFPQKPKASNYYEEVSDEDESRDQVVYNHNHLESLRILYQRGKQDATQCGTSENIEDLQQRHLVTKSLPPEQVTNLWASVQMQPSEKESKTWASLEKLHAFSFGRMHGEHFRTQRENCLVHHTQAENDLSDLLVTEASLDENSEQFQSGPGPGLSQLGKSQQNFSEEQDVGIEEAGTWCRIFKEAAELDENCLDTSKFATCTSHSEKRRMPRGNQPKHRFKFSIRPTKVTSNGKMNSSLLQENSTNMSLAQRLDALANPDNSLESSKQVPIVERLQGLFENNSSSPSSSYKLRGIYKRKEPRLLTNAKRILPSPSSRCNVVNEDILDSFENDEASRDHATSGLIANTSSSKGREQTMSDLFQEALNAAPEAENSGCLLSRSKGTIYGFSNRLQKVLEHEKQQRIQFLKISHLGEKLHDEVKCIDVRVLAKSFEAKLIVCKCTVENGLKSIHSIKHASSMMVNNRGNIITVIFSSRTSGHLEIEVGNFVRIHPPWKELQLAEHEKIIVCTYFCEMAPL